jgi:hypothetical protein
MLDSVPWRSVSRLDVEASCAVKLAASLAREDRWVAAGASQARSPASATTRAPAAIRIDQREGDGLDSNQRPTDHESAEGQLSDVRNAAIRAMTRQSEPRWCSSVADLA